MDDSFSVLNHFHKRIWWLLRLLVVVMASTFLPTVAVGADVDGDGMEDAWETLHGLNPSDGDDAFADLDGDRVPNLWEFDRGTLPDDVSSFPSFDAVVDGAMNESAPIPGRYKTFQEAYDAVDGGSYRSLIRVVPGMYETGFTGAVEPKKTAWLADRAIHKVEVGGIAGGSQFFLSDDTVLDSLLVTGFWSYGSNPAPLIVSQPHGNLSPAIPEVRLVNVMVTWGNGGLAVGGCENNGCVMTLDHCTLWNNFSASGPTQSVFNMAGTLNVVRSIIGVNPAWITGNPTFVANASGSTLTTSNSVISTMANSVMITDPNLTDTGYPQYSSTLVLDAAGNSPVSTDIHGWPRLAASADLGAVEWNDSDNDLLPDWWEWVWFHNLNTNDIEDNDGDLADNLAEYFWGTNPLVSDWDLGLPYAVYNPDAVPDTDADGLPDWWEIYYFGSIWSTPDEDPDNDFVTNFYEWLAGSDPTVGRSLDADNLPDSWEMHYFGNLAENDYGDFPDNDGLNNIQEYQLGLDPTIFNNDWDLDGILNSDEIAWFGAALSSHSGNEDFDNDGLTNEEEIYITFTNPTLADTNGDGILDGAASALGFLGSGQAGDYDQDGLSTLDERALGTNPFSADTDGDGVPDNLDKYPLDPLHSAFTTLIHPGPPVITLILPHNAILQP